ncbi:ArsR family transcriptional regulator [Halorubrum sp. SP9]|uniref:DUF7342 family protein n=1 Tax=Halorubrum sp. SP9 TaxID=1537267 RepID=UPI0010F50AB0|nr:ArsR family transcriptional regulator [Halorubrum sp. SP9]TKX69234.1 ArsR family transcriptional regulator [Halorubrum sp. SP9]
MVGSNPNLETWIERTSPFERVWSVIQPVSEPRSANWVASEAAVADETARTHLDQLVEVGVLVADTDTDPKTYAPDPIYQRFQTIRELLAEHDRDGLEQLKANLQGQIATWQADYEAESPAALRERATAEANPEKMTSLRRTAADWDLAEYRLKVIGQVLRNYDTYRSAAPS